jgi:hypothetical protein
MQKGLVICSSLIPLSRRLTTGTCRKPGAEIAQVSQRIESLVPEIEAAYRRWDTLEAKASASGRGPANAKR